MILWYMYDLVGYADAIPVLSENLLNSIVSSQLLLEN